MGLMLLIAFEVDEIAFDPREVVCIRALEEGEVIDIRTGERFPAMVGKQTRVTFRDGRWLHLSLSWDEVLVALGPAL